MNYFDQEKISFLHEDENVGEMHLTDSYRWLVLGSVTRTWLIFISNYLIPSMSRLLFLSPLSPDSFIEFLIECVSALAHVSTSRVVCSRWKMKDTRGDSRTLTVLLPLWPHRRSIFFCRAQSYFEEMNCCRYCSLFSRALSIFRWTCPAVVSTPAGRVVYMFVPLVYDMAGQLYTYVSTSLVIAFAHQEKHTPTRTRQQLDARHTSSDESSP